MTKYFIPAVICFLLAVKPYNCEAHTKMGLKRTVEQNGKPGEPVPVSPEKAARTASSADPAAANEPEKGEKSHKQAVDETPHIHHFHKHRVKKLKRHTEKCWFLSQLLVVACHLLLLVMAYEHILH